MTDRSAPPESTERTIHAAVAAVYTQVSGGMCLEAARWVQTHTRAKRKTWKIYLYLSWRKKEVGLKPRKRLLWKQTPRLLLFLTVYTSIYLSGLFSVAMGIFILDIIRFLWQLAGCFNGTVRPNLGLSREVSILYILAMGYDWRRR